LLERKRRKFPKSIRKERENKFNQYKIKRKKK